MDAGTQDTIAIFAMMSIMVCEKKWKLFSQELKIITLMFFIATDIYAWWLFAIKTNLSGNLIMTQVGNSNNPLSSAPHDLIWLAIMGMITLIAISPTFGFRPAETSEFKIGGYLRIPPTKHALKVAPLTALFAAIFVITNHEFTWNMFYMMSDATLIVPRALLLELFMVTLMLGSLTFKPFGKHHMTIFIAIITFDLIWLLAGFPITVGFYGRTEFYPNITVNMTEIQSWVPIIATATWIYLKETKRVK